MIALDSVPRIDAALLCVQQLQQVSGGIEPWSSTQYVTRVIICLCYYPSNFHVCISFFFFCLFFFFKLSRVQTYGPCWISRWYSFPNFWWLHTQLRMIFITKLLLEIHTFCGDSCRSAFSQSHFGSYNRKSAFSASYFSYNILETL